MTDHPYLDPLLAKVMLTRVPGIGPRLISVLLEHFGSTINVLSQSRQSLLSVPGLGNTICDRILTADPGEAERCLDHCERLGVTLLDSSQSDFPASLQSISDTPPLLYVRGTLTPQDDLSIAMVGSRRCSPYGIRMAGRIAGALARAGFTIVSGLARGIDAAAHRGALTVGGRTTAVLASGVEHIYPPEHLDLAHEVMQSGALVSECPLDQKPRAGLFPQRNRIISGLSQGVVIIEATKRSGSLHTARHAMEQGREVFALPGPVDSLTSEGCHNLIRDGATLIRNVDDILEQLGPLTHPARTESNRVVHHPREVVLNPQESEILNAISTQPTDIDHVVRTTKLDPSRVLSTLTVLEMRRFIRRLPGNQVVRT